MSGLAPARPLSGGLWALVSWLRRADAGSGDSLSSAGSDGSVASFAFLAPERCRLRAAPRALPPPPPPTDSYRKRVRDRNVRLRHDRDLTLHRKYGLFRGENTGYDAFSLPSARKVCNENRERPERERRAASEGLPRRAAHVPGKRRAPPPPAGAATLGARAPRKRPAPLPPPAATRHLRVIDLNATIPEEAILTQMSSKLDHDNPPSSKNDPSDCKPKKHIKKEIKDKDSKRSEKSFLKQIFENRKRNSAVETIPDRILPSISELDKQAAEIIESCKLKALNRGDERSPRESPTRSKGDKWFCTRCLRKYDDSVVTCVHCVSEQKMKLNKKSNSSERTSPGNASKYCPGPDSSVASTSGLTEAEEKQKLKEMLKEIRDSLPKRAKHGIKSTSNLNNNPTTTASPRTLETDAATLRIGSKVCEEGNKPFVPSAAPKEIHEKVLTNDGVIKVEQVSKSTSAREMAVVTQPIVLQHSPSRDIIKLEQFKVQTDINSSKAANKDHKKPNANTQNENSKQAIVPINKNVFNNEQPSSSSNNLNIPLKISSLLNSIPQPETQTRKSIFLSQTNHQNHQTNPNEPNVLRTQNSPQAKLSNDYLKPTFSVTSILTGTAINSQQCLNPSAQTAVIKVARDTTIPNKDQAMPKVQSSVKTTSTTQTSPVALLESKSPNSVNYLRGNAVNNKRSLLEKNSPMKNDASVKLSTAALSSSVTSSNEAPSLISLPSNNPNTNIKNAVPATNLKLETKEDNKDRSEKNDRKISNGLLGSEVPQMSLDHRHHLQCKKGTQLVASDQHSRRRDLINQLEQSIAKGDESAAAEAAAKLAQLRLSCSVLSFSSQIVGAPSTSYTGSENKDTQSVSTSNQINQIVAATPVYVKLQTRVSDNLQSASAKAVTASTSKISEEKKTAPVQFKSAGSENQKLSVKVVSQTLNEPSTSKQCDGVGTENDMVSIDVWIEDREAARGPIRMNMPRAAVMGDLRRQADASLGLAARLQRWIVGRTLCTDDKTPLHTLAGPGFDAPFYLCLVEPESNKNSSSLPLEVSSTSATPKEENLNEKTDTNLTDVYSELVLLERHALVPNAEEFECGVCMEHCTAGQGAVLRECVHTFCRDCLTDVVRHCEEPAVCCPAMGCPGILQEREIRALVSPQEYERWLARGLAAAESGTRNAFHCRTRDCTGWALCETGVTRFPCPVCKRTNCVSCEAIHEGNTCEQYRAKQAAEAATQAPDQTDEGTRAFLDTLISRGEALECPECSAIITKKWGCDWIKCSACKTEICWVTRGRRWGPGGRGDTSAGCRCGVDGKRCHPSCGYCH